MNTLDTIFVVAVGLGFVIGCCKGIISQLSFGAGIIIGLLQAILFYRPVGIKVSQYTGWESMVCNNIVAFVLVIVLVMLVFKLIGLLLKWIIKQISLGFIDRILGGLFTGAITALLFVGVVLLVGMIDENIALFGKTSQEIRCYLK